MPDITAIAGVASSLNAASQIAKSLIGLRDATVIQAKVIELQGEIISAQNGALASQAEQAALLKQVGDLEAQIAALKEWETEKQRYELKELKPGALAYSLKESMANGEPRHEICANCYSQGFKSILQRETRMPYHVEIAFCPACGAELFLSGSRRVEHKTPKPSGRMR